MCDMCCVTCVVYASVLVISMLALTICNMHSGDAYSTKGVYYFNTEETLVFCL